MDVDNALLTAGVACLIGALVGGGLKAFGIELPVIQSRVRQAGLAVVGLILIVVARPGLLPVPVAAPSASTVGPAVSATSSAPSAPVVTIGIPATPRTAATAGSRAPSDAGIVLGGPRVSVRTAGLGQHVRLGFAGQSSQAVSIVVRDPARQQTSDSSPGCDGAHVQLLAPGEQQLAAVRGCTPILGTQLPADGTYLVDLWTDYALPADFTVRLFDASPQAGQIEAGGSPLPIRTVAPGQHVRLTFTGEANQAVSITVRDPLQQSPGDTSLGCDGAVMQLLAPGGQSLGGVARCGPLRSTRLPVDGTYTVDFSTVQELPSDFVVQVFAG